jgi:glycosyltransferase involved in cell wall biosynthesis
MEADVPLISVLMPVFNCRQTVAQAMESVLAQTLGDFELIAIDDGSTDDSAQVINEFAARDRRVRAFRQENRGVGAALNAALDLAGGKYLARMDADDRTVPERFAEQVAFLDEHPEIAVVGGWHRSFGAIDGRVTNHPAEPQRIKATMLFRVAMSHPTVMMRQEQFARNGWRYAERQQFPEDYDLWVTILQRHELANLPKVLLAYRIWPGSVCQRPWPAQRDQHLAVQCRLMEGIGLAPNPRQRAIHRALAFDEIPAEAKFLASAHEWLNEIWRHNEQKPFFDPQSLARVLTGRYIALVRAAARCGEKIAGLTDSMFRPYVEIPLPLVA